MGAIFAERKRIDWAGARQAYVEGITPNNGPTRWPTFEEVAEAFGIKAQGYLRRRAGQEGWTPAREQFQAKRALTLSAASLETLKSKAGDFDNRMFSLAQSFAGLIALRLNELSRPNPDGTRTAPSASEVIKLTIAMRNVQAVGKIALGDWAGDPPTQAGGVVVRIVRDGPVPQYGGE